MTDAVEALKRAGRGQIVGIGLVNLSTFCWATNIVLGRWLRAQIGPLTLAASRFLIGSILFAALIQWQPPEDRRLGPDRWLLLAMGLSGVAFFAPMQYLGLRFTTAVNATLIQTLAPLITGLLATLLIREPMSRRQASGAAIGLIGVLCLISGGSTAYLRAYSRGLNVNLGDFILLVAVSLWSLYTVLGRRVMHHRSPVSASAFSAFLGTPFLWIATGWEVQTISFSVTTKLVLAILYIGIVPTVIAFLAWNSAVRRLGPSGVMTFYNTLPLYGVLLSYLLLNEAIGIPHVLGGALIIGGGIWAAAGRLRVSKVLVH
jgi:drug/metabolite transporter (DMT)-like permease